MYENCKSLLKQTDSTLAHGDFLFTQKMVMESRGGDSDNLVFRIKVRNGKFERDLVSSNVPNGTRFDSGYDAFDKMFLLYEYFSDKGKVLSSCDFEDPPESNSYAIRFTFSEPSDTNDPLSSVTVSVNASDFAPTTIREHIKGLPLGMEFIDIVNVSYDKSLKLFFPAKIVMRIYGKFFFLHGEIGKVTIYNEGLQRL